MEFLEIIFLTICILVLAIAYGALFWGLVMYKFWYWFLLPVFPTLPQITFVHAMGLAMFMSLFHTIQSQVIKKEYKDETASIVAPLLAPWVTLVFGWIIWAIIY